jgi:HSP20 family protein
LHFRSCQNYIFISRFSNAEFSYGRFDRTVKLPVAVQNDRVKAEFDRRILTLNLPKLELDLNRVVKINLGGEELSQIEVEAAN